MKVKGMFFIFWYEIAIEYNYELLHVLLLYIDMKSNSIKKALQYWEIEIEEEKRKRDGEKKNAENTKLQHLDWIYY